MGSLKRKSGRKLTTNEKGHYTVSGNWPNGGYEIEICPVNSCDHKVVDAFPLFLKLDEELSTISLNINIEIGVAGCIENCTNIFLKDVGILGRDSSYTVVFGGNQEDRRHFGEVIAKDLNEDDVIDLTCKCLSFYDLNAQEGETAADFLERMGVDTIRKACN